MSSIYCHRYEENKHWLLLRRNQV